MRAYRGTSSRVLSYVYPAFNRRRQRCLSFLSPPPLPFLFRAIVIAIFIRRIKIFARATKWPTTRLSPRQSRMKLGDLNPRVRKILFGVISHRTFLISSVEHPFSGDFCPSNIRLSLPTLSTAGAGLWRHKRRSSRPSRVSSRAPSVFLSSPTKPLSKLYKASALRNAVYFVRPWIMTAAVERALPLPRNSE